MSPYVLFCDSSCDLKTSILRDWGYRHSNLRFKFNDSDREYLNDDMPASEFYGKMRAGHTAKTSAVTIEDFLNAFEEILKTGTDILYIGFSSGLSATYNTACAAAEELRQKYPERKLLTVDTFAASAGYGLILYLAKQVRDAGKTMEEVEQYVEDIRFHVCHWFTVDDLSYLARGGRVVSSIASLGGAMQIKPVMHMDNPGHLVPMGIVRGRKKSLKAIAKQYGKLAVNKGAGPIFISYSDCMDDVKFLEGELESQYGAKVDLLADIGPVIGAHTGPGCIALFFLGTER